MDNVYWIGIEVVNADQTSNYYEFPHNGLKILNCTAGKSLEMLDNICGIVFTDELILIRTEDRDFRDGRKQADWIKDNREENNIYCFDIKGNLLWNIGEVVGDIKMAFDGMYHITPRNAKKLYGKFVMPTRYLFHCIAGDFGFLIDGKKQKLICKKSGFGR